MRVRFYSSHKSHVNRKCQPSASCKRVCPSSTWFFVATYDDRWSYDAYPQWAVLFLQGPLCHELSVSVGVWPWAYDLFLLLLHSLWSHLYYAINDLFWITGVILVVYHLLNSPSSVAVSVCSRNMREYFQVLAFFCELKHSHAAHIVYLNRIEQWVVKVDTCCDVDDSVQLFYQCLSYFWLYSQSIDHQISAYCYNLLAHLLFQIGIFCIGFVKYLSI